MPMTAFQTAELYELLGNRGGRLDREGPFLLEALAAAPQKKVADLACGLGLHAEFFAAHGAEVHAFDLSPEMIAHAVRYHSHPNIAYAVGDMCAPAGGPYGLVVCLGNSLCLLENGRQVERFFQHVFDVLLPGGILITQTLNYQAEVMKQPRVRAERAALPNGEIAAVKRFFPTEDRTELVIDYLMVTDAGMNETRESYVLRHLDAEYLRSTAASAGFTVAGCYGSYAKEPLERDSADILISFKK